MSNKTKFSFEIGKCYKLIGLNNWVTYSNDRCLYGDRSGIFIKRNDGIILILSQFHKPVADRMFADRNRMFISFFYKGDLLYTFVHWDEFDKFEEIQ